MENQNLLTELATRLPELEWKMREVNSLIPMHNIPKGLFRCQGKSMTPTSCIAEIKEDIRLLSLQNGQSAHYIANQMRQKINVLVFLCQTKQKATEKPKIDIRLKALSTRVQWVQTLEEEIQTLEQQRLAVMKALAQTQHKNNVSLFLTIQGELGEIEEHLTLAKEKLTQNTSS